MSFLYLTVKNCENPCFSTRTIPVFRHWDFCAVLSFFAQQESSVVFLTNLEDNFDMGYFVRLIINLKRKF